MWWLSVKKLINILIYVILLGTIGFVILYFYEIYKSKKITGKIIYCQSNYLEIMTDNNAIYQLNYDKKCSLGEYVAIYYSGKLDDTQKLQNVKIKQIKKESAPILDTKVKNWLDKMSLEEKIGQLLLARIPNTNKIEDLQKYHFGGYILFQRDMENKTKQDLKDEISNYQEKSNIPLFIATDEEGGVVSRLNCNDDIVKEKFLSPRELYKKGGFEFIEKDAIRKRDLLSELGINVNLAPVADMSHNENSFIYQRTFGNNSDETAEYIKTILKTQNNEVSYVLKHFPGYGDNLDTHTGSAFDNRSFNDFLTNDFKPFISGINHNARFIMMSHNIVTHIDNMPTSLSRNWHNILRNQLQFKGIIVTDDLSMQASLTSSSSPYITALKAGNNLLIVSDYQDAFEEIKQGIQKQIITEELIDSLIIPTLSLKSEIL